MNSDQERLVIEIKRQRGELISQMVMLEKWVDIYIAQYFCSGNKVWELMELIIATDRISFESKVQVFKVLIKRHDADFASKNKNMVKEILQMIKVRNVFAHYIMFTGDSAVAKYIAEGKMTFVKFKNETTYPEYSLSEINGYIEQAVNYTTILREHLKS